MNRVRRAAIRTILADPAPIRAATLIAGLGPQRLAGGDNPLVSLTERITLVSLTERITLVSLTERITLAVPRREANPG